MTKQERFRLLMQIEKLKDRKSQLVDEFIGHCEEINYQIKQLKKELNDGR